MPPNDMPDFAVPPKFLPNLDSGGHPKDDVTAQVVYCGLDPSAISCQIHNDSDYVLLIDDHNDEPGYAKYGNFYVHHRIIFPHTKSTPFGVYLAPQGDWQIMSGTEVYFRLAVWNAPGCGYWGLDSKKQVEVAYWSPKRFVDNHIKEQDHRYVCVGDGMHVMSYLYVKLVMPFMPSLGPYQINMVESNADKLHDDVFASLETHQRKADTEYEMTTKINLEGTVKVLTNDSEEGITSPNAFIFVGQEGSVAARKEKAEEIQMLKNMGTAFALGADNLD